MSTGQIVTLAYMLVGIVVSLYIVLSYIRGVFEYIKQLYTARYVKPREIKIQFGNSLHSTNYEHWTIVIGISFLLTIMHIFCALFIWPVFSVWLISYTIRVAREKNFGSGDY
ncbi:hypothetical protein pEaSNUABM50_00057 [Erwinia phage pEa_SNUABM_50]|uniref:Uncharacterized protein n=4 Tax=Eneladusvirus BF TaxID=2560751 RepID=A0A7L8ZQ57_9CAUD|nr:membrane protein [Serratia phage BF]QOI70997.1 putative membrane protein [Erwinia phage pEa_SNUABM_12]QOI71542.1 putative membrane protein [Erwinia phage pEa_SNUABM_47]QOI72081.1 hypothetical protein pEaSNUABM50_00057 [Erwinia phage pEa_SNUABM_50]QXO11206.1 hypothetical protein pEaSNUABM19_00060 [Erwinia phage pEa_SNUABM_19]QXO11754.1 hypothetical protein pEaSNUABM44_00058 [Erwinia phage pEa_SNUABM_44]QXO12305.1 hypothetical protein pEaSNUABM49_00059 [Erwinia phage pEa_SNUABM_49]